MNNAIYIFGHKNPDTDSVCSAISLSYLKNQLGINTEARILSEINEETKYVLNRFKFDIPKILRDVKLQVNDINYHRDFYTYTKDSVYNAFLMMSNNNMSTIPVVNEKGFYLGAFAMKDIAKKEILGDTSTLKSSYELIKEVIDGKEILKFNENIEGSIINIDLRSTTFSENKLLDKSSILVVGDRHSIIEEAINTKIKLLIITDNKKVKEEHLEIAKKNKVNIMYTKKSAYETLQKIGFSSFIESYEYNRDLKCINNNTYISDLNDIINKTRHSYYPVIDDDNKCLGLLKVSDLQEANAKKVMLVDHNEITQSVDGLEEAEIIGIVDHHKLGNIGTNQPINFRNMTVGSTCTIVYELFNENKIEIPKNIGSLLLCGLLSDTLCLKSPTTTEDDQRIAKELSQLTNISIEELAMNMFKAGDIVKSKTIKEIVHNDVKIYSIGKKTVFISQINTLNSKAILKQKNSYIKYLNKESASNHYDIMLLSITDIFKEGSYILFNETATENLSFAMDREATEGMFLEGIVSRKKQLLPIVIAAVK